MGFLHSLLVHAMCRVTTDNSQRLHVMELRTFVWPLEAEKTCGEYLGHVIVSLDVFAGWYSETQ